MSTEETFVHCSEYNKFLNELKLAKEELILTCLFALLFYRDVIDRTCTEQIFSLPLLLLVCNGEV